MEFLEFEGKTTEEAIKNACAHFQLPPENLEIEIVSVGSPGLFGLGSKRAKVRAAVREVPEADLLGQAQEILEQILAKMRETAQVKASWDNDRITLKIESADAGLLIGKQGQTLEALQYLVSKILSKKSKRKTRLVIDIESYRTRHCQALTQMALKYGDKVKKTGKPLTLSPMNPHDRRIVHLALQGDAELKTMSRGEGLYKKVVIYPVKKKEESEDANLS
jgi:spoIIIJ-associated protein|uniref:RNA-binding protein KhpB n=1 Tax=Desulfobacca acetoxidans TaxID=60893 RepID=A0A7C3SIE3_9BACT